MSVKTQKRAAEGSSARAAKAKARAAPLVAQQPPGPASRAWLWVVGSVAALAAALTAYWPALHGEFLFDDIYMHFASPHPEQLPFRMWVTGARPLADLSYWLNYQISGADTFGYHLTNVLLHTLASLMAFLIVRKILELAKVEARRGTLVAGFCAAIFLLHPVQTEGVAYIAQRSENLSVALAFAAWACFLYRPASPDGRPGEIRFPSVLAVLLLFGAAVTAKEHVSVLPLVILLTDYYWNPGFSFQGVRRNWRLYGTLLAGSLMVAAFLYSYLAHEPTVGFNMKEFTWYQYLFTQCRVLFLYLRLFLLPINQTADYAIELSHTPLEHGAIFGMLALVAATSAAIVWRKRYPIASYGFFVALIFFLPTSSFYPIRDLATERRMYLPMIGLLLIVSEILLRIPWNERRLAGAMVAIVLVAGVLTWNRSFVWSSQIALWSDTAEKSPGKTRPHVGLAAADLRAGRYADAVREYELVKDPQHVHDGIFISNYARALDGAGRLKEAIPMGRKAMELGPGAATYAQEAQFLAEDGDTELALGLLDKAEKYDADYQPIYIYRGKILKDFGRRPEACAAFGKALALNPKDPSVYKGLAEAGCAAPR